MEYGIDWLEVTLARRIRELGQALTGAALSGVLLCEGLFKPVDDRGLCCYTAD